MLPCVHTTDLIVSNQEFLPTDLISGNQIGQLKGADCCFFRKQLHDASLFNLQGAMFGFVCAPFQAFALLSAYSVYHIRNRLSSLFFDFFETFSVVSARFPFGLLASVYFPFRFQISRFARLDFFSISQFSSFVKRFREVFFKTSSRLPPKTPLSRALM